MKPKKDEPKTLKDLIIDCTPEDDVVDSEELKSEAIKWVKWLEQDHAAYHRISIGTNNNEFSFYITRAGGGIEAITKEEYKSYEERNRWTAERDVRNLNIAVWVKRFFNISDEDLK